MASLGTANVAFPSARNALIGDTSSYTFRINLDTDALWVGFTDEGTTAADEGMIFISSLYTALVPDESHPEVLASTTVPHTTAGDTTATAGFFDAADSTFTGSSLIANTTSTYEKLIIWKRQATTGTDPLLYHFGFATGLAINPNGADITVVWNSSGIARH